MSNDSEVVLNQINEMFNSIKVIYRTQDYLRAFEALIELKIAVEDAYRPTAEV